MAEKTLGDYIITVKEVCKTFPGGVTAVRNFSTDIRRSEVLVIMGPSGSGKSTLLRCLNGLEERDSGQIVVDGIPLDENKKNRLEIRKEVGMVFQSFNLFPHLTVAENVNLAQMRVRRKSREEAMAMTRDMLDKVGILNKIDAYPAQLSGGQQQRVAIARALVNEPAIILADEPTGNLDTKSGQEIMELLLKLNRERGTTLIIVTHAADIAAHSQRIIRIRDGVVEEAL
jgi:polar amino acid transport system ATP-binding protein